MNTIEMKSIKIKVQVEFPQLKNTVFAIKISKVNNDEERTTEPKAQQLKWAKLKHEEEKDKKHSGNVTFKI